MTAARPASGQIRPNAFRPGQRLTVVDAEPFTDGKGKAITPPFAACDTVICDQSGPASVRIQGDPRLWKAARFVAAS